MGYMRGRLGRDALGREIKLFETDCENPKLSFIPSKRLPVKGKRRGRSRVFTNLIPFPQPATIPAPE